MPAQRLSYKVDVDTGQAVRDLARLGTAGADAGRDIADGFDTAKSASKAALDALNNELDNVESSAKATADAVAAIKAHLTVDVDDAKVAGFVSDLRGKMGVAFDDITADAKQFADVLERGVNLDRTTSEIRGVGTELEHVRGEADQSRSVLANMAGNATQDLGELGGVAGTLGVTIGQLAEYATEGGIGLKGLAAVAGPMAGLAAASAVASSVIGGFRDRAEAAKEHMEKLNEIFVEGGDVVGHYAEMIADVGTVSVDSQASLADVGSEILGIGDNVEDVTDTLDAAGVTLREYSRGVTGTVADAQAVQLAFDRAVDAGRITEDQWRDLTSALAEGRTAWTETAAAADQATRMMVMGTDDVNDAIKALAIKDDPLAVLTQGMMKFGTVMIDPIVAWRQLVGDLRDGQADIGNTGALVSAFADAMGLETDEVIALAQAQGEGVKSTNELEGATRDATDAADAQNDALRGQVDALQAVIDKRQDMIDSVEDLAKAQQEWDDTLAAWPATVAGFNAAMDAADTSAERTEAINAERDAVEQATDQYAAALELRYKSQGVEFTALDRTNAQAHALASLAGTLGDDVIPALASYYRDIFKIPAERTTEFEQVLLDGDQAEIEAFIAANSGTKQLEIDVAADQGKLDATQAQIEAAAAPRTTPVTAEAHVIEAKGVLAASFPPQTIDVHADTNPAKQTADQFRRGQEQTPILIPVKTYAAGGTGKSAVGRSTLAATGTSTLAAASMSTLDAADVSTLDAPAAMSAGASSAPTLVPTLVSVGRPVNVNLSVSAAVISNRFDLQRIVLDAMAEAQRLGRIPA